jgi:hypothetical protein
MWRPVSDTFVRELIAKHLALAGVSDISPDDYWKPQREEVKDAYRLRAANLIADLQRAGFKVISEGDLEDLVYETREEAYDRGRIDEHELHFG